MGIVVKRSKHFVCVSEDLIPFHFGGYKNYWERIHTGPSVIFESKMLVWLVSDCNRRHSSSSVNSRRCLRKGASPEGGLCAPRPTPPTMGPSFSFPPNPAPLPASAPGISPASSPCASLLINPTCWPLLYLLAAPWLSLLLLWQVWKERKSLLTKGKGFPFSLPLKLAPVQTDHLPNLPWNKTTLVHTAHLLSSQPG